MDDRFFLCDTHILLWSLFLPSRLKKTHRLIIQDPTLAIYASAVSLWEIAIKYRLGKLDLDIAPEKILDALQHTGFTFLALEPKTILSSHHLPTTKHKDPFDRMLTWQSIQMQIPLISVDRRLIEYQKFGLDLR